MLRRALLPQNWPPLPHMILMVGWLWEGFCERRRCSKDTYPESYCIAEYALIRR